MSEQPTVLIYTRSNPPCSYCDAAKQLLREKGMVYEERDATDPVIKQELIDAIPGHVHKLTVPQIFIDGQHLGGHHELQLSLMEL